MFLNNEILTALNLILRAKQITKEPLNVIQSISGGSINDCFKLKAGEKYFVVKVNSAEKFPNMFLAEAEGLKLIRQSKAIEVPDVIAVGAVNGEQYLAMDWIEQGINTPKTQELLGIKLAQLHKCTSHSFGLDHDNYMGSLVQKNKYHINWTSFFISQRIEPQLKTALEKNLIDQTDIQKFGFLFTRLDHLYPSEKPALIHGDLWSGNYMINSFGEPFLIDPAVAYGNREADVAITTLFGGFRKEFYEAYNEQFPLQQGWEDRLDLWNLYPLLIHLNLFGSSYLPQIRTCLNKFVN